MAQSTTDLGFKRAIYRMFVDQYRSMGYNRKDSRRLARSAARIPTASPLIQPEPIFKPGWDHLGWKP